MSEQAPPQQKEEDEKSSATYKAGCHCGYIKFSVTLTPPLPQTKVLNCNCSACTRFGYLLVCEWLFSPLPPPESVFKKPERETERETEWCGTDTKAAKY
jgi:hypothetical protein